MSKATVYGWLKDDTFRHELRPSGTLLSREPWTASKANISKATGTLVKLLDIDKEVIRARAAEDIIEFSQKAIENGALEKRIAALEERLAQQGGNHSPQTRQD